MSELKTPEILYGAGRQYRGNQSDDFLIGFDKDETIKIVNELQSRIASLEERDEWISVDDRLPDDNSECLVFPFPNRDMNIISASYRHWDDKWEQDFFNGYDYEEFYPNVTHWKPITPPKVKA